MKWSWKLGRVLGIDIFIHATFILLLLWVAVASYTHGGTFDAAISGVAFMLAVFAAVVLHELGHALVARRFGVGTRDITLLPIGGVARLERTPERPRDELVVALAGPAVSVAIAAALFALVALTGGPFVLDGASLLSSGPFFTRLLWVNVTIAAFNLLPAFPMDGGRALRALLAMRTSYLRATQIAARLGQGIALGLGVFGLFFNPFLAFVALFVWIGAASESAAVEAKAALEGFPVHAAMITDVRTLSPGDSLGTAVAHFLAGSQLDFPVVGENEQLVGVLARSELIRGLAEHGTGLAVQDVMTSAFETADPSEMLDRALARLPEGGLQSLIVVREGRVLGLVTLEHVAELVMVRGALQTASASGISPRPDPGAHAAHPTHATPAAA
jgi:Zn-dependent protease/CBS domain-containing protein